MIVYDRYNALEIRNNLKPGFNILSRYICYPKEIIGRNTGLSELDQTGLFTFSQFSLSCYSKVDQDLNWIGLTSLAQPVKGENSKCQSKTKDMV